MQGRLDDGRQVATRGSEENAKHLRITHTGGPNLPAVLAPPEDSWQRALRGDEEIMTHHDNATAPGDTKGSPIPHLW